MRHLFITCFVHFSQICQDNPTTMGTSCLLSQVGVREKFPSQLLPVRTFYHLFFSQYEACCFPSQLIISANCAPSHGEKKNECWIIFFQRHGEKKRSNVLALVKNDNFSNISLSIMCRGMVTNT